MMEVNQTTDVLDFDELEKSFNASMEGLKKSLGDEAGKPEENEEPLEKAKSEMDYDDDAEESDEEEDDEEEEEEDDEEAKGVKKSMSIESQLAAEPEAEAAMDVSPFLKHLVKALDRRFEVMHKSLSGVSTLAKSIGNAQLFQMELQKSQTNTVNRIAQQDQKTSGVMRLGKSRFDSGDGKAVEVSGPEVLSKSQDWLKEGFIDLVEAGMIETRVNKGLLGKQNDKLDAKVSKLIKEAK